MISLRIESPDESHSIDIESFPVLVGRDQSCDVVLRGTDSDIASATHFELIQAEDAIVVRDCSSTNGTFLNGVPIDEGPCRQGDVISVGWGGPRIYISALDMRPNGERSVSWRQLFYVLVMAAVLLCLFVVGVLRSSWSKDHDEASAIANRPGHSVPRSDIPEAATRGEAGSGPTKDISESTTQEPRFRGLEALESRLDDIEKRLRERRGLHSSKPQTGSAAINAQRLEEIESKLERLEWANEAREYLISNLNEQDQATSRKALLEAIVATAVRDAKSRGAVMSRIYSAEALNRLLFICSQPAMEHVSLQRVTNQQRSILSADESEDLVDADRSEIERKIDWRESILKAVDVRPALSPSTTSKLVFAQGAGQFHSRNEVGGFLLNESLFTIPSHPDVHIRACRLNRALRGIWVSVAEKSSIERHHATSLMTHRRDLKFAFAKYKKWFFDPERDERRTKVSIAHHLRMRAELAYANAIINGLILDPHPSRMVMDSAFESGGIEELIVFMNERGLQFARPPQESRGAYAHVFRQLCEYCVRLHAVRSTMGEEQVEIEKLEQQQEEVLNQILNQDSYLGRIRNVFSTFSWP